MGPEKTDVIVIGEGMTGLGIAHWLKKRGIEVTLFAKGSEVGGTTKSVQEQGFLYETGASTAMETTPLFKELITDLKLENEFIYTRPGYKNRYILRNGVLHLAPAGLGSFLTTKLFSTRSKFRLLKEPFVKRKEKEESVAEFFKRRLGDEFLDYAIDPLVIGKFAGKPEKLSIRSTFPELYALEEKYNGLLKGMIIHSRERKIFTERVKKFSFQNGMQTLPNAIAKSLGRSVVLNAKVTGIVDQTTTRDEPVNEPDARSYLVEYLHDGIAKKMEADIVVFAVPAYDAAPIVKSLSVEAAHVLSSIYYSPVVSVFVGAKREDIGHPLDGFGFLVPSKENRQILGCIWNSSLFGNRAPSGMVALNAFIGGTLRPELTDLSDDRITQIILDEFKSIMQFSGKPVYLRLIRWKKAIPQYEIGHQQKIDALTRFEESQPGIVLAGNYRGGVSMGDCVKNAYVIAETISEKIISTR